MNLPSPNAFPGLPDPDGDAAEVANDADDQVRPLARGGMNGEAAGNEAGNQAARGALPTDLTGKVAGRRYSTPTSAGTAAIVKALTGQG